MEDFKGDDRFGCRTFAVTFGLQKSRVLFYVVGSLSFVGLLFAQYYFYMLDLVYHLWFFVVIELLFIVIFAVFYKANDKKDYSRVSLLIKLSMLLGIISMVFFWF
ncbi:MAG: hypothetical protein C0598_04540 [Marinilabiliales bacterium]|nr:MAG: hypothetical protein C0598_04540 [Marinilabiliales bacterium]